MLIPTTTSASASDYNQIDVLFLAMQQIVIFQIIFKKTNIRLINPTNFMTSARRIKVQAYQFNPREYVTHYANQRQVIIWKQIFDTFDTDQDGVLAPRDLLQAMSKYNGYHPKRNYIYQTIALFDKNQSGSIDFRQFLKMIHEKPYQKDTKDDMIKVFNQIDQDFKGYLDEDDLRSMAGQLKEQLSQQQIRIIMSKLDPKKTGKISLQAFLEFNRQKIY